MSEYEYNCYINKKQKEEKDDATNLLVYSIAILFFLTCGILLGITYANW